MTKPTHRRLRIAPATRYPADPRAVFVLTLCIISGVPLLLGLSRPGSIESVLPAWAVLLWGLSLTVGAALTLAGMARQTPRGIIAEQIGSVAVGSATIFYATAIIVAAGMPGLPPAAIILGWGLSCFWRWGQLQALIRGAVREASANGQ